MKDTAESYVREWSTLTGRAPSDIYVPESLREAGDVEARALSDAEALREPVKPSLDELRAQLLGAARGGEYVAVEGPTGGQTVFSAVAGLETEESVADVLFGPLE